MGDVLGVVLDLDVENEGRTHGASNLKPQFLIVDAGEPLPPGFRPHPRYAEIAAACRACGMDIADDDFELIDSMSEDPEDRGGEPGFVTFLASEAFN